jgi:Methane oxygenase PmoA
MNRLLCLAAGLFAVPLVAADPTPVKMKVSETTIEFTIGDELVTTYHISGEGLAKPYLWPMNAPGGVPVTRGWPMQKGLPKESTDHVHQKSAWFCHGDVIPEGIELKTKMSGVAGVDFWAETAGRHGRIVHTKFVPNTDGMTEWNEWVTPDGVKIMDEVRSIGFKKVGPGYLYTIDTELKASVCPITFGDTKEGSMGIRIRDDFALNSKTGTSGVITSSDGQAFKHGGKDNLAIWGRPADWNDYSGAADGRTAGIAIFDHPSNRYRANWHTRVYGLMAANPFGRDKSQFPAVKGKTDLVKIAKGDSLKLKYALYVHDGDAKDGKVAEAYTAFAK